MCPFVSILISSFMLIIPFDLAPTKQSELRLWINHDASRRRVYSAPRFDPLIFWLWSWQATSNRVEFDLYRTLYCWIWGRCFSYSAVASLAGVVRSTFVIVRTAECRRLAVFCVARCPKLRNVWMFALKELLCPVSRWSTRSTQTDRLNCSVSLNC